MKMLFGHNTNVTVGKMHLHVQTEDRGVSHGVIETTVYLQGRLLHKRSIDYRDRLPLDEAKEAALKQRLDEQHHAVMEELKTGKLQLPIPEEGAAAPNGELSASIPAAGPKLKLRIVNGADWLKGRHASLKVRVTDEMGNALPKATVV